MYHDTNKNGGKSRAKNSRRENISELCRYFINLNDNDPHQFKNNWQKIAYMNLSTKDLSQILFNAAKKVRYPAVDNSIRGEILSYVRQHFDVWFDKISSKINQANHKDMANTAWVIAALDSLYRHDSLSQHYHIFRSYIDEEKIMNIKDQQQIRYADLWFFGRSTIPNIDHQYETFNKKSRLELAVRKKFHGEEMKVQETSEPVIADLPQAIDFVTKRRKVTTWNEVDGMYHFLNARTAKNPSQLSYNLSTIFNSALIQKLAPPTATILRIDSITAKKIQRQSEIPAHKLCLQLSKAVSEMGVGVFGTTDNPNTVKRLVHPRRDLTIVK